MPLDPGCPGPRPPSPEVTGVICLVPSTPFSQSPEYTLLVHLCRFRVRSIMSGFFPGPLAPPNQSNKVERFKGAVTSDRPRTINLVPIAYAFRPRLRGRLTPRGLAWRRNPWTYGESVSHTLFATHVSILASDTSSAFRKTPSQAYGTLRYHALPEGKTAAASACGLSPVTFSAQKSC